MKSKTSMCSRRMKRRPKSDTISISDLLGILICLFHRYDRLAFRYVSYAAGPLLVGYTIYSLTYEPHKGWYSFTIKCGIFFIPIPL